MWWYRFMSTKDERKLVSLTNRAVRLMNELHNIQLKLSKLEDDSAKILRKLLKRDGKIKR